MSKDSYTPEQAMQMSCCVGNPSDNPSMKMPCISEKCMAWRWSQAKQTAAYSKAVIEHAVAARKDNPKHKLTESYTHVLLEQGGALERTEGYCGIAGFPHNALKP